MHSPGTGRRAVLYRADPVRGAIWKEVFSAQAPDLAFHIWPDMPAAADVHYLVAWEAPHDLLAALPNLELLFSTGAGVDQFDFAAIPPEVSVVRMVEPGITDSVVEYVTLAVLAAHRDLIDYRNLQAARRWHPMPLKPAGQRRIGVMGVGHLGKAVLDRLAPFGFALRAWSRSAAPRAGVETFTGAAALPKFLGGCDILVCLLPLTPETQGLLGARELALLPRGACLINAARGRIVDQAALLTALDDGQLGSAILDVVDPEPLPAEHPFWQHPRVLLTPHVAGMTRPDTAAQVVIDAIRAQQRGERPAHLIDRDRRY